MKSDRIGKAVSAVITDAEIREGFYKQSATINALVDLLVRKGIITAEDLQGMVKRRDVLVETLRQIDDAKPSKLIRPA